MLCYKLIMTKTTPFTWGPKQAKKVTVKLQIWSGLNLPDKNICHFFCDNLQNPVKRIQDMGHFHLTLNVQPYSISLFLEHLCLPGPSSFSLLLPSPAWLHSARPSDLSWNMLFTGSSSLEPQTRLALHSTYFYYVVICAILFSCLSPT